MQTKLMSAIVLLLATSAFADSAKQSDDGVITLSFDKPARKVSMEYGATRWGMYDVQAVWGVGSASGDKMPHPSEISVQVGDMKSVTEKQHTIVRIPKDGKSRITAEAAGDVLIASLVLTPSTEGKAIVQSEDHSITLHCRDAIVHGTTLRYEYQPIKTALGYWVKEKDWASWDFDVKYPGKFNVFVMHGSTGGSEVEIKVGEQPAIKFTAKNTGSFHTFTFLEVGTVTIDKPGAVSLTFKPTKKSGAAIMDLRQVILQPVMR